MGFEGMKVFSENIKYISKLTELGVASKIFNFRK